MPILSCARPDTDLALPPATVRIGMADIELREPFRQATPFTYFVTQVSERYVFEVGFIDIHLFAPAATSTAAGLSASAGTGAVGVAPAAEELDVVGDHVDGAPLGAVLGLPGSVLQATFHKYGVPLVSVVRNTLAEIPPRGDVEKVYLIVLREHPIHSQSEPAHRRAALREP